MATIERRRKDLGRNHVLTHRIGACILLFKLIVSHDFFKDTNKVRTL